MHAGVHLAEVQHTMSAPTLEERILEERIDSWAQGSARLMARLGPMLPVAEEASALEPEVAAAREAAGADTRDHIRGFWSAAAKDGLLPGGSDTRWLTDTTVLLLASDAYAQGVQLLGWTPRGYERWAKSTLRRLVAAAEG